MGQKAFNRDTVDLVKRAIGAIIDPLSAKKIDAIEPGSEGGLRRRKAAVKQLPEKKRKRVPFL